MAFSAKQLQALRRNPNHHHIRTREANGRELTYLEGWYAISEANRIFGFDGWSRERLLNPAVYSPAKTAGLSWRSTSLECESPFRRMAQSSYGRAMAAAKVMATPRRRSTTLP